MTNEIVTQICNKILNNLSEFYIKSWDENTYGYEMVISPMYHPDTCILNSSSFNKGNDSDYDIYIIKVDNRREDVSYIIGANNKNTSWSLKDHPLAPQVYDAVRKYEWEQKAIIANHGKEKFLKFWTK